MPKTPEPLVFLPDGTRITKPINEIDVDGLIIPASMVLAEGFVISGDGKVTLTLVAASHVTLRYTDDNGPAEHRFEMNDRPCTCHQAQTDPHTKAEHQPYPTEEVDGL